jgi:hypothetical protein
MKTTTYKCDRCGVEDTTGEIILQYVFVGCGEYLSDAKKRAQSVEWCLKCRIETGLISPLPKMPDIKPIEPAPTLEEMIREIVRDEIQNA